MDYLSQANNDLITYEKGFGATKILYGPGYERLSRKVTLEPGAPVTPRMNVAANTIGTSYYQADLLGSPLLSSNEKGELLRHSPRNAWGELTLPLQEEFNTAGIENSLLFTNYSYDSVLDHYFAQARFYDAKQGRMLGKDPVKRGVNPYPYCKNSPKNYVDPTGEVANILVGGALGGVIGGAFGYVGSAISQKMNGEKFNSKKAWGAAANGAVVGAVRGALVGSGVGMLGSLGANFGAGALGSAFEQKIGTGKADFRKSVTDGLTNAVSSAIYGNDKLKSLGSAFLRGAGAGAATVAIQNLSDTLKPRQTKRSGNGINGSTGRYTGGNGRSPYTRRRDPRACGAPSAFQGGLGYRNTYGYQYQTPKTKGKKSEKFSLGGFAKDVLLGAVMGGLSSALFYGAGKGVEKLKGSLKRNVKGGSKPENIAYRAVNQKDYDRYSKGLGLEAKNPNGNWGLKEHILNGSGKPSWSNDPYISTTTDLSVAQGFNNSGSNLGIAVIDMNKVPSATYKGYEIFPRTNGVEGLPYHYSIWQQEISVHKNIPFEAIKDFIR